MLVVSLSVMFMTVTIMVHRVAVWGSTNRHQDTIHKTHRRKLNMKLETMQRFIESRYFVGAVRLVDEITIVISPVAVEEDIETAFRFVNESLTKLVPLIGSKHDTALFQVGFSLYYSLLWTLCHSDRHRSPNPRDLEIRLIHLFRLRDFILSILKGIAHEASRSCHRYHYKYKELQHVTGKIDTVYIQLLDPVQSRWMRLMLDAATLQCAQPLLLDASEDSYYNKMIDAMYNNAMLLFIGEIEPLRRASEFDEGAISKLYQKFRWMANQFRVPTALEYCVVLSKEADQDSELGTFHHLASQFYYDFRAYYTLIDLFD